MKRPITAALLCASLVFASTAAPVHAKAPPPHKNAPQKTPPKLPKSKLLTHKSRFKTATSASLLQLKSKSLTTMGKSTQSLSVKSLKSGPAGTALGKLQPSKTKFDNAAMVSNKRMPGSLVSLNPQPLPPEPPPHEIKSMLKVMKGF